MPEMGVNTLKNNLTNPARSYLWDIVIPSPIGGGDGTTLQVRAQSTSIPGRSFGTINVPYKQSGGVVFAGKLTYSHSWECTFVEGEDGAVHSAIYNWKQSIVHDYNNVGLGDDAIKQDIYLNLLGTDGSITRNIKLIGCFPSAVADVAVDYAADEIVRYPVTFAYDHWEIVS